MPLKEAILIREILLIYLKRVATHVGVFLVAITLVSCAANGGPVIYSDDHQVNILRNTSDAKPLSNQVRASLKSNARTRTSLIYVSQGSSDTVTLSGQVNDQATIFEAERIAYTVQGVRFVVNNLLVSR